MKVQWGTAFQIAAVYVGTVVGAGFATGKEIVEFFSRFGLIGLFAILISGCLLMYFGAKLMRIAANIGAKSYEQLNEYLFGKWFGKIINFIMLLMLIGVSSVMLSGAGAVFEEHLHISKMIGIICTISLATVVMAVGMKGLFTVNTLVVPMMIGFSLLLFIQSIKQPHFYNQLLDIPYVTDGWKAVLTPFSYAAFNLSLAQAVLVPIASEIKDDRTIMWGGLIGGFALTVILLSSHFTLVMLPNLEAFEIPMAVIMKNIAANLYWIYVLVIYGEIFTSVIGNVFGIERQLQKYIRLPQLMTVLGIFLVTFFISLINYGTLLSLLYPLFGYISLIFLVLLWVKPVGERMIR